MTLSSGSFLTLNPSQANNFAPWKKGICPFAFQIIMSNGNSSKFCDVITNPHYWGQDLQCMNVLSAKSAAVLWPEVSNNLVCINNGSVVMYLKYQMCVIGICALMSALKFGKVNVIA